MRVSVVTSSRKRWMVPSCVRNPPRGSPSIRSEVPGMEPAGRRLGFSFGVEREVSATFASHSKSSGRALAQRPPRARSTNRAQSTAARNTHPWHLRHFWSELGGPDGADSIGKDMPSRYGRDIPLIRRRQWKVCDDDGQRSFLKWPAWHSCHGSRHQVAVVSLRDVTQNPGETLASTLPGINPQPLHLSISGTLFVLFTRFGRAETY